VVKRFSCGYQGLLTGSKWLNGFHVVIRIIPGIRYSVPTSGQPNEPDVGTGYQPDDIRLPDVGTEYQR
jgi:hypothetical protein